MAEYLPRSKLGLGYGRPPLAVGKTHPLATPSTLGLLPRRLVAHKLPAEKFEKARVLSLPLSYLLVSVHCPAQPSTPVAAQLLQLC